MRLALRCPDGDPGRIGDLLERPTERVLEHHARLRRRHAGERVAELTPELRRVVCGLHVLDERLVHAAARVRVAIGVERNAVQPRRELRVAAELAEARTRLGERILRRVARVVGIAQHVQRQALDPRCVAFEQDLERALVAVLCTRDENRVAQLLVGEAAVDLHAGTLNGVHELAAPVLRGRLGNPYTFVEECTSTQRLLGDDDEEGATVVADHQTAGRGRLGRMWEDVPGRSLLLSVLLRPPAPMPLWPELSLVAGGAVARAIGGEVRPPNDVFLNGKKVAGILPEATRGRVILGIGVNVNHTAEELPSDTVKPPTSLRLERGHDVARAPLLAEILVELEQAYDAWSAPYRR